jgi:hypothetical protein
MVPATGEGQFEGIVESKNLTTDETGAPQRFVMTMWIKADRVKVQISAMGSSPGSTVIYRNDRGVIWMLNDEDQTYYEVSQDDQSGKGKTAPAPKGNTPFLRKPGRTRKILGYVCNQYVIKHLDTETEIWGTRKLSNLVQALSKALGSEDLESGSAWSDELTTLGVFPMVATTKIEGRVVESSEVTKVQPQNLQTSLFEIPTGYRKQSTGDLFKDQAPVQK